MQWDGGQFNIPLRNCNEFTPFAGIFVVNVL
nr:MAG TPA: PPPDE putative peptidase domain [Caudoviricetes sp.]